MRMKPDHLELLKRVLALPPEVRAALAGSLIDSLDDEIDDGVEAAWEIEIAQRLRDVEAGKVTLVPWSEARRQIVGD